jgi:polyferredoxin/NAD-dependent dihydropyrimidine dehydrogenase PreA subunit
MDEPASRHESPGPGAAGERRATGGWRAARWARRVAQVGCLVLFVFLLFAALQRYEPHTYTTIFFRFDPLAALAPMLAARAWLPQFGLALVTVALSIVLGRYWCGWVCPLGTLLGWFRFRSAQRTTARRLPPRLRSVKYLVLTAVITMAAFGSLWLMVFDPLSLLTRTATTSLVPGFDYAVTAIERAASRWPALQPAVGWVDQTFRGNALPIVQPHFAQSVALFLVFLAVVLLNALADRFWCRYLCPLGALLALLAKVQILRPLVGGACTRCGRCVASCRVGAIDLPSAAAAAAAEPPAAETARVVSSECTMCLDCLVACPEPGAMSFGSQVRPGPWTEYDPGRRRFLGAAAAGVGAVVLLGTGVWRVQESPALIRPPGVTDEASFLSRCLRCSECMKVCPTSGLQPALTEAGLEGVWSPVLRSRLGYCDYACTACGHTCPSGAIPKLDLAVKRRQVLGIAVVDRNRCLPWAQDTPCIVCQEMCPVPDKAITLTAGKYVTDAQGGRNWLQKPVVVPQNCIGCGICEYRCPVSGTSAIVVERHSAGLALPGAGAYG